MSGVRTIRIKVRGCGKRRAGQVYLVSEPRPDGVLPIWTDIDPPIEYKGEWFRSTISVWLDLILERAPYEEYVAGASAERVRRNIVHEPEIESYGMGRQQRLQTGGVFQVGLPGFFSQLHFVDIGNFGIGLRGISGEKIGKAQPDLLRAWREAQNQNFTALLACLWRIWFRCPEKQKRSIRPWIRLAMISINAGLDAQEVI